MLSCKITRSTEYGHILFSPDPSVCLPAHFKEINSLALQRTSPQQGTSGAARGMPNWKVFAPSPQHPAAVTRTLLGNPCLGCSSWVPGHCSKPTCYRHRLCEQALLSLESPCLAPLLPSQPCPSWDSMCSAWNNKDNSPAMGVPWSNMTGTRSQSEGPEGEREPFLCKELRFWPAFHRYPSPACFLPTGPNTEKHPFNMERMEVGPGWSCLLQDPLSPWVFWEKLNYSSQRRPLKKDEEISEIP